MAATGRLNTHLSQGIYCFVYWVGFKQLLGLILVLLDTLKPKLWGPVWRRSQSSKSSMPYTTRQVQMSPNWLQCTVLSWSSSPSSHLNIFLVRYPVIYECYSHATPINPTCKILQVMLVAICHCTIAWMGMKLSTYCQFNICCVTMGPKKTLRKNCKSTREQSQKNHWALVVSGLKSIQQWISSLQPPCTRVYRLVSGGPLCVWPARHPVPRESSPFESRLACQTLENETRRSGFSKWPFSKSQRWAAILEVEGWLWRGFCNIFYVYASLRHSPRHLRSCRILRRRRNSRASSSRSPHSKATLGAHWVGQLRSSMQEEWISPPKGSDILLHSTEAIFKVRT